MQRIIQNVQYLLFTIILIIGIIIFQDYGIFYDEIKKIALGENTIKFFFNTNNEFIDTAGFLYGSGFEMPSRLIQKLFPDEKTQYFVHHLTVFILYFISLIFFYKSILLVFKEKYLAIIGVLLLYTCPRLFADAHYNSKDMVYLSGLIISFYTLLNFINKKNLIALVLHSLVIAWLMNIRIMGVIMVVITVITILYQYFQSQYAFKKMNLFLGIFLAITFLFLYFTWPFLHENTISRFFVSIKMFARYGWNLGVLFKGTFIEAFQLPFYYAPLWIIISTPIVYLILFLISFIYTVLWFIKNYSFTLFNNIIYLATAVSMLLSYATLFLIIFLHSTLYDGCRHIYFMFPFFILIVLFFLFQLKNKKILFAIIGLIVFEILHSGYDIIKTHPHQYVYFNKLMPKKNNYIFKNFEQDYWGVSFKQGIEHVYNRLVPNTSDSIKMMFIDSPGYYNLKLFDSIQLKRTIVVDSFHKADYFITNYRFNNKPFDELKSVYYDSIEVNQNPILWIYHMHKKK